MTLENRIQDLANDLAPTGEQQARIRARLQRRIEGPAVLFKAKEEATPVALQKKTVKQHLLDRLQVPGFSSLFDQVRSLLRPSSDVQSSIKQSILARLAPVTPEPLIHSIYKWGAAFVVVVMALRVSPLLFLTPQTIADSSVILQPSATGVELSSHGLWQPVTKELELHDTVLLRTAEGEATIMLHDDGNVRLAAHTIINLDTVSDQTDVSSAVPTVTLSTGILWLQALLPDQLPGFVIATAQGTVTAHGGSVSIQATDKSVHVEAWDRHVTVSHNGQTVSLVAGEYVDLMTDKPMIVQNVSDDAYRTPWIAQNLRRDAVHRREMAQLQQERRAAEAGILPSSPFYAVKRAAENMDVLLTLDPEARAQKRLQQAGIRLNEAAALILQGDSGSNIPLNEYKQTLLDVASGSGNSAVQYLVQQTVAENAAQLSAALPDSQLYALKKAVLEASAQISNNVVDERDVSGTLLIDTLDVLQQAIQNNDTAQMKESLQALAPYLPSLQSASGSMLKPEVQKEALSLLSDVAVALHESTKTGTGSAVSADIATQLSDYLPKPPAATEEDTLPRITLTPSDAPMTEAELAVAVRNALHRVFDIYTMPHSRINALRVEIKKFQGTQDEGRFLRRLYRDMPDNDTFRQIVRTAIQNLRVEQFVEDVETGSGAGAQ